MACISKLASAIAYDCDSGATGLESAVIINKADIESYTVASSTAVVMALTLVSGAKPFKIDTVKRSLVVSSSLKINDGAPNAHSHSASITMTANTDTTARLAMDAFANGSFVIVAKWCGRAAAEVYGLYYGMSATGVESNSHDNGGWATITLETPENVIGEDTIRAGDVVYADLLAAAVG
jgi:hypothetical protein